MVSLLDAAISDEEWYRRVHRPNEAQLTVRAVGFGCIVGTVLSAANLYTGLTIGWLYGASMTAAITGFLAFRQWSRLTGARHFTVLENNTMQTAASAAAAMAGAGMVNAIPALMVMTHRQLGVTEIAVLVTPVGLLGVCFAIPIKRQMINVENLRFPSGIATAEAILALHGEGGSGRQKGLALGIAAGLAGVLAVVRDGFGRLPASLPRTASAMTKLTLQLDLSLLFLGAGALVGLRTTASMAAGGTLCWGFLAPWAVDSGWVHPSATAASYFGGAVTKWCMWPGVTMLVVSGLVSFALKTKSIVRALASLGRIGKAVVTDTGVRHVEMPATWFLRAFLAAAAMCIVAQYVVFGMGPLESAVAIGLSGILALVGVRAQAETDVNPMGAMGKVTQLAFSVLAPGNVQANLMAAGITAGGANSCGDMMQDLKTGRLLGASPRKQFVAQLVGVLMGGFVTAVVFVKVFPIESIGTKYAAPSVQTWRAMAELLTQGASRLPLHTPEMILIAAVFAIALTVASGLGAPRPWKRWLPSPTGLGLSFILPASNSYTFFIGAILAALVARRWPKQDQLYGVATASGLIAGESIAAVGVALLVAIRGGK